MAAMSRAPVSTTQPRPFPPVIERGVSTVRRPLSWLWSRGFRFLVALDAITLYALMVIISFVRFGFSFDWDTYPLSRYFVGFAIATAIHLVVNYVTGLYERTYERFVLPLLPYFATLAAAGVFVLSTPSIGPLLLAAACARDS